MVKSTVFVLLFSVISVSGNALKKQDLGGQWQVIGDSDGIFSFFLNIIFDK